MAQPIDLFVAEIREDLYRFETAYRAKAEQDPETYPLERADVADDDDTGPASWLQMFVHYVETGHL